MVLAVTVLTYAFAAGALEIDAGRVEETHRHRAEQVAPAGEKRLLDSVLVAPKPLVGPQQVMILQPLRAGQELASAPAVSLSLGAGFHQPVHDVQVHRTLDVELLFSLCRHGLNHRVHPQVVPQT